ncbi:DUF3883 domain-containing protein [Candidatus Poribacteria bacterium]|nr:DUF3883 domain-containing protein [Candidatus Poribacteria bacterium]
MSQSQKEEIQNITQEALKNQPDALADIGRGEQYLRQDYQGRYVFELLQNIRDAALIVEDDEHSSAFFFVTETALIVANYGKPFDLDGIKSIRSIGLSTKSPRPPFSKGGKSSTKYIGHKGIGFKSVFEITENPQIFSGGYQLQFSREKTVQCLRQYASTLPDEQRLSYLKKLDESKQDISIMHIPHWMSIDEIKSEQDINLIQTLQEKNCSTLIRLPFKHGVTSDAVFKHLLLLPKEALLFLGGSHGRRGAGILACEGRQEYLPHNGIKQVVMKNLTTNRARVLTIDSEQKALSVPLRKGGQGVVRLMTLQSSLQSQVERWLVFATTKEIPDKVITDEQREIFSADAFAEISIALSLDDTGHLKPLTPRHRLFYVYFPTQEPVPIPCLIHSFFQLKPARTHFYECALNEWLCEQVVSFLTSDVLEWLKNDEHLKTALPFLLIPSYPSSSAAQLLRNKLLPALRNTAFVPTVDYRRFVKPSEICLIPDALSEQRVGVSLSSMFSDKSISEYFRTDCYFPAAEIQQRSDIVKLLRSYGAREFTQEVLLAILDGEAQIHRNEPHWFQQLYHFLRNATYILAQHSKKSAEAFVAKLKQKKILLSINHQLYAPNGEVQIFLPPLRHESEIAEVPDALKKQFEFLHPQIKLTETNDKGDELLNGLGNFLVKNGFVKTFQFSEVLEEGILPQMEAFDETFAEAERWRILRYIKHLFDRQLINASALKQLPMGTIRVPVFCDGQNDIAADLALHEVSAERSEQKTLIRASLKSARSDNQRLWMAAQDVYFPATWSGQDYLEQLYKDIEGSYFLTSPIAMGIEEAERESWKRFFDTIGVNEIPRIVRFTPSQGYDTADLSLHSRAGLMDERGQRLLKSSSLFIKSVVSPLSNHPLAKESKLFNEYLSFLVNLGEDESFRPAVCWRIHEKARQTLEQIFALDKFDKLIESEKKRTLLLSLIADNWSFYSRFKTSTYQCSHLGCNKDKQIPSFFLFCLKHAAWIPTTLKTKEGKPLFLPPEKVWVMSDPKEYQLQKYLPFAQQNYDKTILRDLSFKSFNSATVSDFVDLLHFLEIAYPKESLMEAEKNRFKAFFKQILQHFNFAIQREQGTKGQKDFPPICRLLTERCGTLNFTNSDECLFADDKTLAVSLSNHLNMLVCDDELPFLFEAFSIKPLSFVVKQQAVFEESQPQRTYAIKRLFYDNLPLLYTLASLSKKEMLYAETNKNIFASIELIVVENLRVETQIIDSVSNIPSIPLFSAPFFLHKLPPYPSPHAGRGGNRNNILYMNAADADNLEVIANAFAHLFSVLWSLSAPHLDDAFLRLLRINHKAHKIAYLAKKGIGREELLDAQKILSAVIESDSITKPEPEDISVMVDLAQKLTLEPQSRQPTKTDVKSEREPEQQELFVQVDKRPDVQDFEIKKDGEFIEYQPQSESSFIRENSPKYQAQLQHSPQISKKRTFEEMQAHQKLGEIGEQYVFKKEKEWLRDAGRDDLSAKVAWVSKTDDTCGYDILSYYQDGREKYIEVKTTDDENDLQFPMSLQEWRAASDTKMQADYYIYRVIIDKTNKSAKVIIIKNPYQLWKQNKLLIDYKELYVTFVKRET